MRSHVVWPQMQEVARTPTWRQPGWFSLGFSPSLYFSHTPPTKHYLSLRRCHTFFLVTPAEGKLHLKWKSREEKVFNAFGCFGFFFPLLLSWQLTVAFVNGLIIPRPYAWAQNIRRASDRRWAEPKEDITVSLWVTLHQKHVFSRCSNKNVRRPNQDSIYTEELHLKICIWKWWNTYLSIVSIYLFRWDVFLF